MLGVACSPAGHRRDAGGDQPAVDAGVRDVDIDAGVDTIADAGGEAIEDAGVDDAGRFENGGPDSGDDSIDGGTPTRDGGASDDAGTELEDSGTEIHPEDAGEAIDAGSIGPADSDAGSDAGLEGQVDAGLRCVVHTEAAPTGWITSRCVGANCFDSAGSNTIGLWVSPTGTIWVAHVWFTDRVMNGVREQLVGTSFGVHGRNDDDVWVAQDSSLLHLTADGGQTRIPLPLQSGNVHRFDGFEADLWVATSDNLMIETVDGGSVEWPIVADGFSMPTGPANRRSIDVVDAYAPSRVRVAVDGTILDWDGASWTASAVAPGARITGMNGDANEAYAVGFEGPDGVVLHFQGDVWSREPMPPDSPVFYGVQASEGRVVVVGDGDAVWSRDVDAGWSVVHAPRAPTDGPPVPRQEHLRFVSGSSATYVAGEGRLYSLKENGIELVADVAGTDLLDVEGTADDDVWAVGSDSVVLHFDGASWTGVILDIPLDLQGVAPRSSADVWIVGNGDLDGVHVLHGDGVTFAPTESAVASVHYGVAVSDSSVFVATEDGVFRSDDEGVTWQLVGGMAGGTYASVWASSDGTRFVASGYEALIDTGTVVTPQEIGLTTNTPMFWDVAVAAGHIWATGLMSYDVPVHDGSDWAYWQSGTTTNTAVAASGPDDVWVASFNSSPRRLPLRDDSFPMTGTHGLWIAPGGTVFAVGEAGKILRHRRACAAWP